MKYRLTSWRLLLVSALLLWFVTACSSGAVDSPTTEDAGSATSIAIGVSASSVPSDDSSSITVTASLLDSNNAAVMDTPVQFSTDSGALSAATAATDANGAAQVSFHSGLLDQSNRVAIITATVGSLTAQVPVQITGSTVTAHQSQSTIIIGETTDSLEIVVTNDNGTAIYDAEVKIEVNAASTGGVTVSSATGNTDVDGSLDLTVTGTSPGTVTLDISAAGAITSCTYTVESAGNVLQITQPTNDPASMSTDQTLTVRVSNPNPGANNKIVLSTTLGTLQAGDESGSAVPIDVVGGEAVAQLTTNKAGFATIQAYDIDNPDVTDSITVAMYAPASDAEVISIQASNTVVAPSIAELKHSVEITARVTNAADAPVGGAPVVFTLTNTVGGGEQISPVIVFTDTSGVAKTTFTSGSLSSDGEGVTIYAYLLNKPTIDDDVEVIIGGTSGSVVLGISTTIESINLDTAYRLGMSVLVADSNGNPVPGASVTMSLWPKYYYIGHAWNDTIDCYGPFNNEDIDRNLILGESPDEDTNGDGELTPPNSSAGNMLSVVVVDENGVGTFSWTYLKEYAGYIAAEIKASTFVLGSETTSTLVRRLPALIKPDIEDGLLGESPFNDNPPPTPWPGPL